MASLANLGDNLKHVIFHRTTLLTFVLALVFVIFGSFSNFWWTASNMVHISWQLTPLAFVGVGQSIVLLSGGVDLSCGSLFGLSGQIAAILSAGGHDPAVIILVVLGLGAVVGLFNGVMVAKVGAPSFVITFGMLAILRAVILVVNQATNIFSFPSPFANNPGLGYLAHGATPLGVAPSFLLLVAVVVAAYLIIQKTNIGSQVRATGGNELAARAAGIATDRVRILTFVFSGVIASFAGMIYATGMGSVFTDLGAGMELKSIAAAVIGGASLAGGSISFLGTLIGCLIFQSITTGLLLVQASQYIINFAEGAIILGALAAGSREFRRFRKEKTKPEVKVAQHA